ncbi:hypothetical protein V2J09_016767 [Rumex salicifolius]
MGSSSSRLMKRLMSKREMKILMVGLDASGKTTILYKIKLGEVVKTLPTIGFNVETVEYRNVSFAVWDVGGQDKIRGLWKHYFQYTQGLIFVVDSVDRGRISEARGALHRILSEASENDLRDAALLVIANKQDLPNAMQVSEIAHNLALHLIQVRRWYIQGASAITGHGLYEGLEWLSNTIAMKQMNAVSFRFLVLITYYVCVTSNYLVVKNLPKELSLVSLKEASKSNGLIGWGLKSELHYSIALVYKLVQLDALLSMLSEYDSPLSELHINYHKSSLQTSSNISSSSTTDLVSVLGVDVTSKLEKYLGILIIKDRVWNQFLFTTTSKNLIVLQTF